MTVDYLHGMKASGLRKLKAPVLIEEDGEPLAVLVPGKSGGAARAKKLTPAERKSIGIKANAARWHKSA